MASDIQTSTNTIEKPVSARKYYLQLGLLPLWITGLVLLILNRDAVLQFQAYGYLGLFLISIIGSASLVIPIPCPLITAAMGAILNPILVGIISAVGADLGGLSSYFLGYGGSTLFTHNSIYNRVEAWMQRWGSITIFLFNLIPNPVCQLSGLAAGATGYPVWKYLLWGGLGRIPKNILYAYAGILGLDFLVHITSGM